MKEKLLSILLVITFFFGLGTGSAKAESLSNSDYEGLYSNMRTYYAYISEDNCPGNVYFKEKSAVGAITVYTGTYHQSEKTVSNKYLNSTIVRICVEPRMTWSYSDKECTERIWRFYGFSQYLTVKKSGSRLKQIVDYAPKNSTVGSDSYTVSCALSKGWITPSFSTSIKKKYCQIIDNSSQVDNYMKIDYDYISNMNDWEAKLERNITIFKPTWQFASFVEETSLRSYADPIYVSANFGISTGVQCGAGIKRGYIYKATGYPSFSITR